MTFAQSAPLALTSCVHCGEPNTIGASFCESCGKALPTAGARPRIVNKSDFADTNAGRDLQIEDLLKQTSRASKALLWVAIIQTLVAIAVGALLMSEAGPVVGIVLGGIAAIFYALYFWSRKNPLPATVCGLVIYITLLVLDAAAEPETMLRGWIVKILIISLLAKGISAGIKHRELKRRMNQDSAI